MTKHYNRRSEKEKRRSLRNNMTYCEKIVWLSLRRKELGYRFLRQYSVDQYILDFYCPKLKLAVEIDGDVHKLPEQEEHDRIKDEHLKKYKISIVRITNEELLGNPDKAFKKIEDAVIHNTSLFPKGRIEEGFDLSKEG